MDLHYTFRASTVEIVTADEIILEVDLGFHVTHQPCISLFGVDADDPFDGPDESAADWRGEEQREFVENWIESAANSYGGNDGQPLSVTTLVSRDGTRRKYEGLIFARSSQASLTDDLLIEFPEIADL